MSMQYEERNFFMYVLYYTYLSPGNLGGHLGSCQKGGRVIVFVIYALIIKQMF